MAAEDGAVAARGAEAQQRQKAEAAQRGEAELRHQAQLSLVSSEHSLYLNRIALAERYWQANNQGRVDQILEACPANLRDWEWRYLKRLGHSEESTLPGDQVTYSPDGKLLATDGKDNSVQVRDAQTGQVVIRLRGDNAGPFSRLAFSPDSRRVAAIGDDRTISIWDLRAGRQTLKLQLPSISSAGKRDLADQTNVFWNGSEQIGPVHLLSDLAFTPDGKRIAAAGAKSDMVHGGLMPDRVTVWDAVSGKKLLDVAPMGLSIAFSADGKHMATACRASGLLGNLTGAMCILDANTGRVERRIAAMGWDDRSIAYSPDGKWLASARHEEIKIWDPTSGKEVRTLHGHTRPVTGLSFNAESTRLASSGADETVRIWNPTRSEALFVFRGHIGDVVTVSFRPDGKFVASGGVDETVRIWNAMAPQGARQIPGTGSANASVAMSPDGRSIACWRERGSRLPLVLVDAATGRELRELRSAVEFGRLGGSVAFSPDSKLLASAFQKQVQIWDAATGQERAHFAGVADNYGRGLAFSPDGARLAFTAAKNSVEVWDIRDHKRLATYEGHTSTVTAIDFSPDGRRVASGGAAPGYPQRGEARIWDAATGREICKLPAHGTFVTSVAFSRDGKRLVTGNWDATVRIWDAENGQQLQLLRGHTSYVWSVAFNPAGTRLVTTGFDGTTKLWAWPSGEEVLTLSVQDGGQWAAFVGDGNMVATANTFGVTVWDASPRPASATVSE